MKRKEKRKILTPKVAKKTTWTAILDCNFNCQYNPILNWMERLNFFDLILIFSYKEIIFLYDQTILSPKSEKHKKMVTLKDVCMLKQIFSHSVAYFCLLSGNRIYICIFSKVYSNRLILDQRCKQGRRVGY